MIAAPGALYLYGLLRRDSYAATSALLAGEAAVDSEIVVTALKTAPRRFSIATVVAQRYGKTHRWLPYLAYGLAAAIGFSRVSNSGPFPVRRISGAPRSVIRSAVSPCYTNKVVKICEALSPPELDLVRQLWREYWQSFGLSMDFQGFGRELEGLPGAYGAGGGALLLAISDDQAAGTIALRRLDAASGELKRLYIRPQFRGRGLGRRLVEAAIERARSFRYQRLYGDTLPVMTDALSLYKRLGFERVPAYSADPTAGAIYLKLKLFSAP